MNKTSYFSRLLLITSCFCIIAGISLLIVSHQSNEIEKDAFSKFEPQRAAAFKWSYPDKDWNATEADAALNSVRQYFEAQEVDDFSREISGSWRMEGPGNIGGRLNAIAQDPFDSNHILAGSAAGGLFGTNDGGVNWSSLTDDFARMAMGTIAFHPTQEGTVYIGTGDPQISSHPRLGDGVHRSVDGGATWTPLGLDSARIVSKILILEDTPEVIMAATMGNPKSFISVARSMLIPTSS